MDQEAQILQKLEEQAVLIQETNERVRRMERLGRFSFWAKVVIWTLVLVLPLLLIGPIIDLLSGFTGASGGPESVFGLPSADAIKDAYELYRGGELK